MKCHGLEQGKFWGTFGTVCSSRSFVKSCSTLCHPMDLRLPCPSLSPRVCTNSCLLSQWYYLNISSSLSPSLPSTFSLSKNHGLFQCIMWPKYWNFSFSVSSSNKYLGLISFRIDWFDLLAVQGTLKNLLQLYNQNHPFFSTQPSLWSNSHICT